MSRYAEMNVRPAKHGGFVVTCSERPGDFREALFAGSLSEALWFIEEQLSPNKSQDERVS